MSSRVLLVEDDPLVLEVLTTVLNLEEFEVTTAVDGEAALQLVETSAPDVVVCDVVMPGVDGIEVCRRLKVDPATADIPVVLLTGRSSPNDRKLGLEAGCDAYLTKPFSPLELIDLVRQYVTPGRRSQS